MSASDAAPLPRLGEVFFDVRGSSRSMRLSWYSDTGVAVFSIWQGGTCTGTFRLPIDDLPRMVDALQRGPRGAAGAGAEVRDAAGEPPRRGPGAASTDPAMPGVANFPDYTTGQSQGAPEPRTGAIQAVPYGDAPYGEAPYGDDPLGLGDGYQQEPYRDRQPGVREPSFQPSYPDEPAPPGYRDAGPPAYRDDPLGTGGGYREHPSPAYRDSEPPYGDDPLGLGDGYQQEPYRDRQQGVREPSFQPSYPDEPAPPAYRDDPLGTGGGYREHPSSAYRDSEPPYGDDPLGPENGYREDPTSYRDEPYQHSYRDEPAYTDDSRGGSYADDPFPAVYPEDSRDRGYPDDSPSGSHPYGPPPERDVREQRAPRGRS